MPNIPKPKPKNFSKILDILNTPAAAKQFSPETYINLVGEYSKKAYDNGELSQKEYMDIVQPLFGDTGIMATEKIKKYEDELNKYADGGRIGFLKGGDTKYNAMVFKMYAEAGGKEGTGMDIDSFAEKYFPKFATGGRVNYNQGSMDPDTMALKEKIEEIMDIEGVDFGTAFKQAMRELASQSRENNSEGTMPKSERWMRDYFFSGKGGYDDRMTYKEFALGPGQELYKRFSKD
jgi:hypothetical protein